MNMAVGDGVIAAGQDGSCCMMKFEYCTQKGHKTAAKDGKACCYDLSLLLHSIHSHISYLNCIHFVHFYIHVLSKQ